MNVTEAILKRRATRKFKPDPVDEKTLNTLLELATWAPSACKLEGWRFVVVKEEKEKIYQAYGRDWLKTAPVLIVVCTDLDVYADRFGERGSDLYSIQDTSAAIENLMLSAVEKGLATCWVGAFDESILSKNLNLPKNIRPVAIVPIGYSDEEPKSTRKPLTEVCHQEKW